MASLSSTGNLGTGSVSALIKSANTTANELLTLDTTLADNTWSDSAKTPEDYQTYTDAINGLLQKAQGDSTVTGQERVASLQQKLVTAQNSYNTAQIDNYSTQILLGNATDADKANAIGQLINTPGIDPAERNKLIGQYYTTVKAADDAAVAAANDAASATNKAFETEYARMENGIRTLNVAKANGQITPEQYDNQMQQMYLGNTKSGAPGIMSIIQGAIQATGDPNGTWTDKLDTISSGSDQKYINGTLSAQNQTGYPGQAITRNADGTYSFTDRTGNAILGTQIVHNPDGSIALGANGRPIITTVYAPPVGTVPTSGAHKGQLTSFEYATNINSNTGQPAPGTGVGAIRKVGAGEINYNDPSGVPYFYNDQGQKKYIGIDQSNGGHLIMANSPNVILGKVPGGESPQQKAKQVSALISPQGSLSQTGSMAPSALKLAKTYDPLNALGRGNIGKLGGQIAHDVGGFLSGLTGVGKPQTNNPPAINKQAAVKLPTIPQAKPVAAPKAPVPAVTHTQTAKTVVAQPSLVQSAEHVASNLVNGAENVAKGIGSAIAGIF